MLGVAGELLADGGVFLFSSQLQSISDVEVGKANTKAGEAMQKAAQLGKDNLVLQADVLKLQLRLADRSLTPVQVEYLISKLKPFTGQRFDIFTHDLNDGEASRFSATLLDALMKSGWRRNGTGGLRWWPDDGVFVGPPMNCSPRTNDAVDALVGALNAKDIGIRAEKHNPYPENGDAATIPIIIARKP